MKRKNVPLHHPRTSHPSTKAIHEKQTRLLCEWVERPQWSRMRQQSHNPNGAPTARRTTVEPYGRACRSWGAAADIITKRIQDKSLLSLLLLYPKQVYST
jgi:hypothetical protein